MFFWEAAEARPEKAAPSFKEKKPKCKKRFVISANVTALHLLEKEWQAACDM